MNRFSRWIEEHFFLLCLVSVLLVAASVWATFKIRLEVTPSESTPAFLFVQARTAFESSPLQAESLITTAVEGSIRAVPGLIAYSTRTNGRGISLSLTLRPGTSLDLATVQVQEALQPLVGQGLLDARGLSVGRFNPEATPLLRLAVTEPTGLLDLPAVIQSEVRPRLESLPEVSKVEITGADGEQLQMKLSIGKVLGLGAEPERLGSRLRLESFRDSVGSFAPQPGTDRPLLGVRARLEVSSLRDFAGQVISSGSALRIQDLGAMLPVPIEERASTRTEGRESAFAEIFMRDRGSPFALKQQVEEAIRSLPSVRFDWVMDRVHDLATALQDVASSLFQSVAITFGVILVFLRNWRRTTLISATIPLTLVLTIAVLYAFGFTLNIMTLSGLILGIGMVVDNVILVVDRAVELRQDGLEVWPAISRACAQSAPALLMATLTNAIIFLPVSFTDSDDSFMTLLKAFQAPILATLAASILLSLLILPPIARPFPECTQPSEGEGESESIRRIFRTLYAYRGRAALLVLLGLVFIGERVGTIPQVDLDPPADPWATVQLQFFKELPDSEHRALFDRVESDLLASRAVLDCGTISAAFIPHSNAATFQVYPVPGRNPDEEMPLLESRIRKWIASKPPLLAARVTLGYESAPSSEGNVPKRILQFEGSRMSTLLSSLEVLRARIASVDGVLRVLDEREAFGKEMLVFIPKGELLSRAGLTLGEVAGRISSALVSASVGPFQRDGKTIALLVSLEPGGRPRDWSLEDVLALPIRNRQGKVFSMAALGRVTREHQLGSLSRELGRTRARLVVEFKDTSAYSRVDSVVAQHEFPPGYGLRRSSSDENVDQMQKQMVFMIGLSSILIYLVLGASFQSLLLPIAVLATIPAAILCGVFGLWILSRDLDVMARLSLVILVGIGVNNAIILIDLIQELRSKGLSREEAVIRACSMRFRAVLMTTTIQVLGVLPVAVGNSKIMGIPYASLGITIISGMLLSTLVTLAVIPWLYDVFAGIEDRLTAGSAEGAIPSPRGGDPGLPQRASVQPGGTLT